MTEQVRPINAGRDLVAEVIRRQVSELNRHVYELAEQHHQSLFDICRNYDPVHGDPQVSLGDDCVNYEASVVLVPRAADTAAADVAERFARIVRAHLSEISPRVQGEFERLYAEVTGTRMYGGYND